jgi:hypothetical protein
MEQSSLPKDKLSSPLNFRPFEQPELKDHNIYFNSKTHKPVLVSGGDSSNIPVSLAYDIYISQLIRYARACSSYDQFLILRSLLTNKLMSQGFHRQISANFTV